ncbi:MAG: type II CRISPR-associated endonuclease Cas1 [Chitinophagales bacterium]|nr:type II CRISPR-associated endonuclease Cas1 [Chitinophagales bacterium]
MIKRTIYLGNKAYISVKEQQLIIKKDDAENSVPIEDIGVLVLDNFQITITHAVLHKLLENNVALITCNDKHHPIGLQLNLDGHTQQSEKFNHQIEASIPLKKQLWQQTVIAKIKNQATLLALYQLPNQKLIAYSKNVLSGDSSNEEAKAAKYYWKHLFNEEDEFFYRHRFGDYPNNFLNYGYAILRATVARGLVASGLLPTLGIFHSNKYNAYCLADDIMEPYRPFVDKLVKELLYLYPEEQELTTSMKAQLLQIPALDIIIDNKKSPLMVGLQRTTASLAQCFEGSTKKIIYPNLL